MNKRKKEKKVHLFITKYGTFLCFQARINGKSKTIYFVGKNESRESNIHKNEELIVSFLLRLCLINRLTFSVCCMSSHKQQINDEIRLAELFLLFIL